MINKASPFKGLDIRIPIIIPIKGRGFINQGSGLGQVAESINRVRVWGESLALYPKFYAKAPSKTRVLRDS